MAAPYVSQSASGYNATPPADDGSAVASNRVTWAGVKTKLADPAKTLSDNINSALVTAFGKVVGGAGVTSTSVDYAVQTTDQGKLVRATSSAITITTPDATAVTSPFVFAVLNNSGGTITVDGFSSQNIDGSANTTIAAGAGMLIFTDGTNWFTTGQQGTLVGKQLRYGEIINGTITESNATNAVTYSLKTLAGNDPSSTDPVLICFRNSTLASGNYIYRNVTAATTLTISAGSTLGTSNAVACRVWLVLFDDAGTIRLGAINCVSGTGIYPLGRAPRASSTAEGGSGGADSAQTFYTGTAVTNKSYSILGYCNYESGISTAGNWNVSPDTIELFGDGVPLPGSEIQVAENYTGAVASGAAGIPFDDTIPQSGEGLQTMTQAITPTSAANILRISHLGNYATPTSVNIAIALFQDSTANSLATTTGATVGFQVGCPLLWSMIAATTSATTFKIRVGDTAGSTVTFNGTGGARKYGGVTASVLRVAEIMS